MTRKNKIKNIIGLLFIVSVLLWGATAGTSCYMGRPTGLRTLIGQVEKYDTIVNKFHTQYGYLPGDMPNATGIWRKDTAHCQSDAGEPSATGTCNGNGDGIISGTGAIGEGSSEALQFWRQLALAGFIEGNYSGVSTDAADALSSKLGSNRPAIEQLDSAHSYYEPWWYDLAFWKHEKARAPRWSVTQIDGQNYYIIGDLKMDGSATAPVMYPLVAYIIDTKLDDGVPNTGRVKALPSEKCAINKNGAEQYNDKLKANACALMIRALF